MFSVFLDRDGVINEDVHFLRRIEDLVFVPRAIDALVRLAEALPTDRARITITSNQSALGRGMCTQEEFDTFTDQFLAAIQDASEGRARIDAYRFCPHHPTAGVGAFLTDCECRKPRPGMLIADAVEHGVDLSQSFMVGDKRSDILAAQAVGAHGIIVRTGCGGRGGSGDEVTPDAVCDDLYDATDYILSRVEARGGV